jgi:hypothetical protein
LCRRRNLRDGDNLEDRDLKGRYGSWWWGNQEVGQTVSYTLQSAVRKWLSSNDIDQCLGNSSAVQAYMWWY